MYLLQGVNILNHHSPWISPVPSTRVLCPLSQSRRTVPTNNASRWQRIFLLLTTSTSGRFMSSETIPFGFNSFYHRSVISSTIKRRPIKFLTFTVARIEINSLILSLLRNGWSEDAETDTLVLKFYDYYFITGTARGLPRLSLLIYHSYFSSCYWRVYNRFCYYRSVNCSTDAYNIRDNVAIKSISMVWANDVTFFCHIIVSYANTYTSFM